MVTVLRPEIVAITCCITAVCAFEFFNTLKQHIP